VKIIMVGDCTERRSEDEGGKVHRIQWDGLQQRDRYEFHRKLHTEIIKLALSITP
jgi:hypothetical protein